MKIMTVLGTRPEIIRLARVMPLLDMLCEHIIVFTGQNYDANLSSLFFEQLQLRQPDYSLTTKAATTWAQIGNILAQTDSLLEQIQPDCFLVLGDTNSALTVQCAKRRGIPVYHMEAGNRCFDDRVPEEVNRRIIDHSSDVLLPYTNRSRDHLLREAFAPNKIYVTGNPIKEVMDFYAKEIDNSDVLKRFNIAEEGYFLVTLHRAENVDVVSRLQSFMKAFVRMSHEYDLPVLLSLHPRTKARLECGNIAVGQGVRFIDPPGFFDFVHLEKHAKALLSDSGTVQEEGCILMRPTVTLRDVTERPETLECGSNILSGCSVDEIMRCLNTVLHCKGKWDVPYEYLQENVSQVVTNIITGFSKMEK